MVGFGSHDRLGLSLQRTAKEERKRGGGGDLEGKKEKKKNMKGKKV
jgi:hypothetical protein